MSSHALSSSEGEYGQLMARTARAKAVKLKQLQRSAMLCISNSDIGHALRSTEREYEQLRYESKGNQAKAANALWYALPKHRL